MTNFPLKTIVGTLTVSTVDLDTVEWDDAPFNIQLCQAFIKTEKYETAVVYPTGKSYVIAEAKTPEEAEKNHAEIVKRIEIGIDRKELRREHNALRDKRFERK